MKSRCKNGTRRNKKTGNCEPTGLGTRSQRLGYSESDMREIIRGLLRMELREDKKVDVIMKLQTIEYDPEYKSAFTGKKMSKPEEQGLDRVYAYTKYGDW